MVDSVQWVFVNNGCIILLFSNLSEYVDNFLTFSDCYRRSVTYIQRITLLPYPVVQFGVVSEL